MIINDLFNNKKFVAEAIGDLGSKRDQGKSIRKWRKSRGLDEQGGTEEANGYNVVQYYEKTQEVKKLTNWLEKNAGLPKNSPLYFDDVDLVYGNKTIVPGALVDPTLTFNDLLTAVVQASKQGMGEATGDERFDTMIGQIQREPKYPDSQMPPTDVKDLYQWAVENNKLYHEIFAEWAMREGYKSVAPALQRAGDLDTESLDYWTPRVWKIYWGELNGIDSEMPPEWAKKRVPDELRDYLDTVFDAYDRIVFDWPTEYRQIGQRGMAEASLGDYRKKAQLSRAMAQTNKFFDRDDPEAVAQADQTIAKREKGLGRADARVKPYTPPKFDAEKHQRDLTAKYPNIDELVAKAEQRRDPNYDRAEGNAYYDGREAEQNYQKLKQIQRVIQGLNESQHHYEVKENKMKLNEAILNEDPIYRTWKNLGRTLIERRMSEKEILQVFADAETGMTDKATGSNRTMLGRGKDTTVDFAGQVKDAVSGVLNSIQNSVPIAAVDVAYDQATDALSNLTGGQKGKVMQAIKGYRNLVKQYPKTAGFAKAALVAITGLATGGAGLPAIAGLTYALDSSIRGDKLSSVIGKGAGAAFLTWLATNIGSARADDPVTNLPVTPDVTPDLATYTAKSGDTLSQIAKDNGTTVRDIVGLNPQLAAASGAKGGQMLNPDVIFPGQEITLPAASGENIYSGGMGTNADTMAQIGRGNMPDSAITQRMAMRESLKFVTLPVDQLIDRELTAMSWVVNESMYNNKQRGVWLTQAGTYAVFENINRYRLALVEKAGVSGSTRPEYYRPDMPGGPGKASKPGMIGRGLNWLDQKAKAAGGALSNFGHQFTTDVTKEKLKMNWHQDGKPSDSDQLAAWLVTQGVPQPVVAGVFKKMNIPYTPAVEPQATEPQATEPKTNYQPQSTPVPNTPNKGIRPLDSAPAPTPAPTVSKPRTSPATTTTAGVPGFNAGNLAQLPGMAQYMKPQAKAKATPNYSDSKGYGKTTMTVNPMQTKTTAAPVPRASPVAAPAGKKEPITIGGQKITPNDPAYAKIMKNAPAMAESLTWSQNFNPGRSLYRRMKQES